MSTVRCPSCGRANTEHESINDPDARTPDDGDLSICWGCRAVAVYETDPLRLRLPTDAELHKIKRSPGVARALSAMNAHRGPEAAVHAARETGRG